MKLKTKRDPGYPSWRFSQICRVEGLHARSLRDTNYDEIRAHRSSNTGHQPFSRGIWRISLPKKCDDFSMTRETVISRFRPEGTAPVRSYVENKLFLPEVQKPSKFYYIGPMFRHERPQAGQPVNSTKFGRMLWTPTSCNGSKPLPWQRNSWKQLGNWTMTLHLTFWEALLVVSLRRFLDWLPLTMKDQLSKDTTFLGENPLCLDQKKKSNKGSGLNSPSIPKLFDEESCAFDAVRRC